MRVLVNGIEIEINGSSKLYYDVAADTLSVDPIDNPKREYNKKPKEVRGPYAKKSAKNTTKLTQEELRAKILEIVGAATEAGAAQQFITLGCLGKDSKDAEKKYLKLLLEEMVSENLIIHANETGRSRYALA